MSLHDEIRKAQMLASEQTVMRDLHRKLGGNAIELVGGGAPKAPARQDYASLLAAERLITDALAQRIAELEKPIDMLLFCPDCGEQHIDEPEFIEEGIDTVIEREVWANPPHRSHLCHECGLIWRPADVATNGVEKITTCGKADTWPPA